MLQDARITVCGADATYTKYVNLGGFYGGGGVCREGSPTPTAPLGVLVVGVFSMWRTTCSLKPMICILLHCSRAQPSSNIPAKQRESIEGPTPQELFWEGLPFLTFIMKATLHGVTIRKWSIVENYVNA